MSTEKKNRKEFAKRLIELSKTIHLAMSQGGDSKILVNTEMADDLMAAGALVMIYDKAWNEAIEAAAIEAKRYLNSVGYKGVKTEAAIRGLKK